jgi:hypothetical protein
MLLPKTTTCQAQGGAGKAAANQMRTTNTEPFARFLGLSRSGGGGGSGAPSARFGKKKKKKKIDLGQWRRSNTGIPQGTKGVSVTEL